MSQDSLPRIATSDGEFRCIVVQESNGGAHIIPDHTNAGAFEPIHLTPATVLELSATGYYINNGVANGFIEQVADIIKDAERGRYAEVIDDLYDLIQDIEDSKLDP